MSSQQTGSEAPVKAPLRWRKPGDLPDVQRIAWRAMKLAEHVAYDEGATKAEILTASSRLTQAVQAYLKVLEYAELEERLSALEEAFERSRRNGHHAYN
jgi:uncharacterized small protein (DUF1192 family)